MLDISTFSSKQIILWFSRHTPIIIGVIIGAYLFHKFGTRLIDKIVRRVMVRGKYSSVYEEKQREDTLIRVLAKTLEIFLWISAILIILSEIGVNIGPLIAGAGIAGLAIGLGGKALIQDIIAGLFIIFENQYRVGDVVRLNGTAGQVEDITLRITIIRDLDGIVHYIPNGTITTASNYSKDFARINLNIPISYADDIEKAKTIINNVGLEFAKDKAWKGLIKKAPQFARVEKLAASAVELKVLGEVDPQARWDAAGEIRHRIKEAFNKGGIEIPYPQQVVHNTEYKK